MRKIVFTNDYYYHVFNRGVDKRKIFLLRRDYIHFLRTLKRILNFGSAQEDVKIFDQSLAFRGKLSFICYCLMPNHYHFLIKQHTDNAISDFMHKLNTSYTKYFNLDKKRTGRLFEYTFKAVPVESDEQLLHLSRYIHLNPVASEITTDISAYEWSSYLDYCYGRKGTICDKDELLSFFSQGPKKYQSFVMDQLDYAKHLEKIKHAVFD